MFTQGVPLAYQAYQWLWSLGDLIFQPKCAGCESPNTCWCPECQQRTQFIRDPVCATCGEPQPSNRMCSRCRNDPRVFTAVRSLAIFDDPFRQVIFRIKYNGDNGLAAFMAGLMIEQIEKEDWRFDFVVPIPLGKRRKKQRGYNQAALLAFPISLYFRVPFKSKAVSRVKDTRSQVGLDYKQRVVNVKGAFRASEKHVSGRTALLVDDVFTTGSTLNECAKAIITAGGRQVYGMTLARAVMKQLPDKPV